LSDLLNRDQRYPKLRKRALSVSDRVREQASHISHNLLTHLRLTLKHLWNHISPYLWKVLVIVIIFGRCISEVVFWIFERRLRPGWLTLKDLSVTAQQIDLRLQQMCYWPIQYMTLLHRRRDWASISVNHPDYIRYYNSLWLVANDVIMGVAFGTYLIENSQEVAKGITWLGKTWMVEGLGRMITWLREWPAGLKLNNELAAFLAELFTYLIEFWAGMIF
jgi:phosphatidylinositol N-acetylglucosaminyltransferase subunit Q